MVARASDAPAGVIEVVKDSSNLIEELARAQGRGSPALRNAAGQVLELHPSSPNPLLTPQDVDSGVQFTASGVQVLSGDGQESRSLSAGNLNSDNVITASNGVYSFGTLYSTQGATINGSLYAGSGATVQGVLDCNSQVQAASLYSTGFVQGSSITSTGGATINGVLDCNSQVQATSVYSTGFVQGSSLVSTGGASVNGVLNCTSQVKATSVFVANGAGYFIQAPDIYATNAFHGVVASERRLKDEVERVTDGLERVEQLYPARWRWLDETRDTNGGDWPRVHVGIYVDELPDEAIVENKKPDPVLGRPVPNGERSYEDRAVIAYLVDAVQALSRRVRDLEARPESGAATS